MKYCFLISAFLFNSFSASATEKDLQSVESVIQAFEQSIVAKDKTRFLSLFVSADAPMFGVVSAKSMVKRRKAVAEINKRDNKNFSVTKYWTSSPQKMITRIVNSNAVNKEVFHNVKVSTDNEVAVVYADYEYFKGDNKLHWGTESWHLIRTLQGWKISSVNYSITFVD